MTKFEQVGSNFQYDSQTKEEATRCFRYSCRCCCHRGVRIKCDHCAIAVAHDLVMAAFDSGTLGGEQLNNVSAGTYYQRSKE